MLEMIGNIIVMILGIIVGLLLVAVIKTLLIKPKKTTFEFSKDQKRIDEYSEILSKMIQVETVSTREDPQIEKFRGFHKTMEELFPTVFEKLEKIEIDGNAENPLYINSPFSTATRFHPFALQASLSPLVLPI